MSNPRRTIHAAYNFMDQATPMTLRTPAGVVQAASMGFGKIVVRERKQPNLEIWAVKRDGPITASKALADKVMLNGKEVTRAVARYGSMDRKWFSCLESILMRHLFVLLIVLSIASPSPAVTPAEYTALIGKACDRAAERELRVVRPTGPSRQPSTSTPSATPWARHILPDLPASQHGRIGLGRCCKRLTTALLTVIPKPKRPRFSRCSWACKIISRSSAGSMN